jgi:hypothetical protein
LTAFCHRPTLVTPSREAHERLSSRCCRRQLRGDIHNRTDCAKIDAIPVADSAYLSSSGMKTDPYPAAAVAVLVGYREEIARRIDSACHVIFARAPCNKKRPKMVSADLLQNAAMAIDDPSDETGEMSVSVSAFRRFYSPKIGNDDRRVDFGCSLILNDAGVAIAAEIRPAERSASSDAA